MNEYLQNIGVALAKKLIDFGTVRLTSPRKPRPEERIEQIDKTLESLESAPDDGQHWTTPPAEATESQKGASLASAATLSPQPEGKAPVLTTPTPEAVDDEYCVGCGPNNHLAKAQEHIGEALRLSRGKGEVIPEVVAPRIQDAVAQLAGYEDGDIKHMRERASGSLLEILDDLAVATRELRNFLRYDMSGLELGKGTIEDLETAAMRIRKLRQLGYSSVMVEVIQKGS